MQKRIYEYFLLMSNYLLLSLGLIAITCVPVRAELSQLPLFLTSSIDPNIMFILDDSGSMFFEVTPDDLAVSWNGYVFPRANNVYGDTDYGQSTVRVTTVEDGEAYTARTRSPQFNTTYYNPSVTYVPWTKYDNTLYPAASPTCAWHNPENTGNCPTGDVNNLARNLTINNDRYNNNWWTNCNSSDSCSASTDNKIFWPATYYWQIGGDGWSWDDYTQVEIRSSMSSYTGHGRESRTDCVDAASGTCSYAEEIQNFANWYTYYRSRILASRAAIGQAFASQDENIRVGYGAINASSNWTDGISLPSIIRGVRSFSGDDRAEFYEELYTRDMPGGGTPLRKALDAAGRYYEYSGSRGPWSSAPGESGGSDYSCRNSYTILMTDGYWSGGSSYDADTSAARNNVDGSDGPNISSATNSYQYEATDPFQDNRSNTLADVAMYYWKRDLQSDLENNVPISATNPAFWQHMVTFGIGLGVSGTIDPDDAWTAVVTGSPISWPYTNPGSTNCNGSECGARLDDLLHASVNSRGGFFSAADPQTFATELSNTLSDIVARTESSAAAIATNSTRLVDESLIFQARFDSSDWSGEIRAYLIESDGSVGDVQWNTNDTGSIPDHGSRNIFTMGASTGIEFTTDQWGNLSTEQQEDLIDTDRLEWLRGDQSLEVGNDGGTLRARTSLLGDVVNSDPLVVGNPNFSYERLPSGTPGRTDYLIYRASQASRPRMLYIGANDGMLHAFNASSGVESFAYVPAGVYDHLADLSDPDYTHRYYVDGSSSVGDIYSSGWRTILAGSLGAGGQSVFALDITDPDNFEASDVLWEYTDTDLGFNLGKSVIARMQNGDWAVIFGNGPESDNDQAYLYIVNAIDGTLIRKIPTGVGSSGNPNGLSAPVLLANSRRTITTAYAGDLQGNLWKFDLSSSDSSDWVSAYVDGSDNPQPLFTARNASGEVQPITAPVEVGSHDNGGKMIYFGTGQYFEVGDNDVSGTPSIQSFYGVWDNGAAITTTDRSTLVEQTIIAEGQLAESDDNYRVISDEPVDYLSADPADGWYMDLVYDGDAAGERVVSAPLLRYERVIFTTLIPLEDPCSAGGTSWIMELDAMSGGRLEDSPFDVNEDGQIDDDDKVTIDDDDDDDDPKSTGGVQSTVGITKTPAVIGAGELEYKYLGGSDGGIEVVTEDAGDSEDFGRRSWRQLR
ncbi:type IV pilus assembly protein PilY1 [Desulfuromusa kysingii]|uniref:Type IV pilus assembly protein PilY1 n=1 Tax=Desulfuromusa kysingii TaxID=37625 RepID=A0A1H4E8Z6_9BACT|nr:PilC/PilY family type IV pilus protein [Desulfuromusa kysingii]SEA81544.1 type IV pilus assembly protein PilY1 [Desulfuromusa kysingii]